MKTNATYSNLTSRLLLALCMLVSVVGYTQPDYRFTGAQLLSGTNLQAGALYRFPNVKSGIDARVTISAISPGVTLQELDGSSGYSETLQPTLAITPWTNGFVEMTINFVNAGTTTPAIQAQIAATCIDVDGVINHDGLGHNLHEFDEINMGGGFGDFSTVGGQLSLAQSGNWFIGTNVAGVDYPGRDTSAKAVMFTAFNVNVSTVIIRVGINNQTASAASRLRSVYFKRFVYPNSVLGISPLVNKLKKEKKAELNHAFKIYPTAIENTAKIAATAEQDGWASFEVVDYSGRIMLQQQIVVNKGANIIPVFNISSVSKGNYVAVLKLEGKVNSQKIIRK